MRLGAWSLLSGFKGPLLIFLFCLFFYFLAGNIEDPSPPGQLGPYFWPKTILILLMLSSAIKGLEIAFSIHRDSAGEKEPPPPAVLYTRLGILIGLVVGVVALMEVIGFLLANLLFLFSFMYAAGMRRKTLLLSTSFLGTLALLFLFVKVVYLPLPKGSWYFEDMTIFLYRLLHLF